MLANDLRAAGEKPLRPRLLQNAMVHYRWLLAHDQFLLSLGWKLKKLQAIWESFDMLYTRLADIKAPTTDLAHLPLWRWSGNVTGLNRTTWQVQHKHGLTIIDGALTEQQCEAIVSWSEQHSRSAQQPHLCTPSFDWTVNAFRGHLDVRDLKKHVIAKREEEICFDLTFSSAAMRLLRPTWDTAVYYGEHSPRLPWQDIESDALGPLLDLYRHLGLPEDQWQAMHIVNYPPASGYGGHTDCSPQGRQMGNANTERHVTVIVYLTSGDGGETFFPKLQERVEPHCGRVAVFRNLDKRLRCDRQTYHESLPAGSFGKSMVQRWFNVEGSYLNIIRPPSPEGAPPFMRSVSCSDDSDQLMGKLPTRCREEAPHPSLQFVSEVSNHDYPSAH
eukprot:gnl/TRDRNA2_/TRDRNA2_142884_c1_seq1.p1 gnl/TRDRNA2_/TRDRNA2_142884_c1~~gnl/TRDRNA2_/TRDRNA2_142884_c1_seq1.p1  ORF type:complete len:422 (-),score=33.80 gnl/TRDRNA2_/TRDRNA2_142884_c1_seq1:3-1166(-)